jgi:hypothetical protein
LLILSRYAERRTLAGGLGKSRIDGIVLVLVAHNGHFLAIVHHVHGCNIGIDLYGNFIRRMQVD